MSARFLGRQRLWLHAALFILTFATTTIAGVQWRGIGDVYDVANLHYGIEYAVLILLFLSAHEFGHFIASRIHGVDATLPFYIPFPGYALGSINFGTFGAVIRTRSRVPSNKAMFDIGVAGPIAGFVVCVIILAVGFATLPGIDYLRAIHPTYPLVNSGGIEFAFGHTILFDAMRDLFARPGAFVPPMTEVYHYPMLCVGWFGLFVTALNLLPIGQLDGGHLTYTLFGRTAHGYIGKLTALLLFAISLPETLLGFAEEGYFQAPSWLKTIVVPGGSTWLVWALLTTLVIRFRHPETGDESPLDLRRKIIAWATIGILILCFTPSPFVVG